jgi:hypothetical protein
VGSADALGSAMPAVNTRAPTHAAMTPMNFFTEISSTLNRTSLCTRHYVRPCSPTRAFDGIVRHLCALRPLRDRAQNRDELTRACRAGRPHASGRRGMAANVSVAAGPGPAVRLIRHSACRANDTVSEPLDTDKAGISTLIRDCWCRTSWRWWHLGRQGASANRVRPDLRVPR